MSRILILHSSVDGHTLRICDHLRALAAQAGHDVTLLPLSDNLGIDLASYDSVVVGASIRYGKHRAYVAEFLRARRQVLEGKRSAFFSVNIVARKPDKNTPETNPYVRKFLKQIGWRPRLLAVFAGKLDYPSYDFWDRNVIRFIMLLTSGPTDTAAVVEFTDWNQVEAFGRSIARTPPG